MIAWADALDAYEASLGHHQDLIESDAQSGPSPWPPRELPSGPVPEHLTMRATALVERSHRLVDEMAAKMANIPPPKSSRHPYQATRDHPRWTRTL